MKKNLTNILSKTARAGIILYLSLVSFNKINKARILNNFNNDYYNKILRKSNSKIIAKNFEIKAKKFKKIKNLNFFYNDFIKNKLNDSMKFYKEKSGYITPNEMQVVSQKKLDSSFIFEKEWNNYMNSKYNKKIPKLLLERILTNSLKKSNKDYNKEIKNIETIEDVMSQLIFIEYQSDSITFKKDDFSASFKTVHKNKKDDCDGGVIYSAGALLDDGFPPYELILYEENKKKNKNNWHALYIYKTDKGNFGTLGINLVDMLYPRYNSIEKLVNKINEGYKFNFTHYEIYDIKKQFPNFINNNKNNDPREMYNDLRNICND